MTSARIYKKNKTKKAASMLYLPRQSIVVALMCAFILFLLLKNSSVATASVRRGLSICVGSLIPSLFPFMIISELVVRSHLASYGAKLLEKPSRKLFGLCGEGGCAFLAGTLCGFPIGAVMGMSLYSDRKLTRMELLRLLCFSSNPGAAFTIITLGREHLGNIKFGILLYSLVCLSALTVGVISKHIIITDRESTKDHPAYTITTQTSVASIFTESVKASSLAMLYICGFVVFFSTIVGSIDAILFSEPTKQADNVFRPLLFGFFELTSGIFAADPSLSVTALLPLCGAILGFSGLSVHFQIMSVCNRQNESPIPVLPFLFMKLLQASIAFLLLFGISFFI